MYIMLLFIRDAFDLVTCRRLCKVGFIDFRFDVGLAGFSGAVIACSDRWYWFGQSKCARLLSESAPASAGRETPIFGLYPFAWRRPGRCLCIRYIPHVRDHALMFVDTPASQRMTGAFSCFECGGCVAQLGQSRDNVSLISPSVVAVFGQVRSRIAAGDRDDNRGLAFASEKWRPQEALLDKACSP